VTGLLGGQPRDLGSVSCRGNKFLSYPNHLDWLSDQQSFVFSGIRGYLPENETVLAFG
jgi:hypothetical protein